MIDLAHLFLILLFKYTCMVSAWKFGWSIQELLKHANISTR